MANIASQIKRNRQNERARLRNKAVKSRVKTEMKKFEDAVAAGDADAASAQFKVAVKNLDKAVTKGVVHRNYAANQKSQMARRLGAI